MFLLFVCGFSLGIGLTIFLTQRDFVPGPAAVWLCAVRAGEWDSWERVSEHEKLSEAKLRVEYLTDALGDVKKQVGYFRADKISTFRLLQ